VCRKLAAASVRATFNAEQHAKWEATMTGVDLSTEASCEMDRRARTSIHVLVALFFNGWPTCRPQTDVGARWDPRSFLAFRFQNGDLP
jgi:hypothetical protein